MLRVVLSHPLPVFGLVGLYPANYLIGRSPIPGRNLWSLDIMEYYGEFPRPILHPGVRSISLLTRPPLSLAGTFDLHALAMPPAFSLSHDQTLQLKSVLSAFPGCPDPAASFNGSDHVTPSTGSCLPIKGGVCRAALATRPTPVATPAPFRLNSLLRGLRGVDRGFHTRIQLPGTVKTPGDGPDPGSRRSGGSSTPTPGQGFLRSPVEGLKRPSKPHILARFPTVYFSKMVTGATSVAPAGRINRREEGYAPPPPRQAFPQNLSVISSCP